MATDENSKSSSATSTKVAKLVVKKIRKHEDEGMIGGSFTFLAVKNHSNYLIATYGKGLKLVKNSEEIYKTALPHPNSIITAVRYIKDINAYLLCIGAKIYRKDINSLPHYLFIDIDVCYKPCGGFKYSSINRKLIVARNYHNITLIDLKTRKLEVTMKKRRSPSTMDFVLLGDEEEFVLVITSYRFISLYCLTRRYVAEVTGAMIWDYFVEQADDRIRETGYALKTDPTKKFVLAQLVIPGSPWRSSRILIFEFLGKKLKLRGSFDALENGVNSYIRICFAPKIKVLRGDSIELFMFYIVPSGLVRLCALEKVEKGEMNSDYALREVEGVGGVPFEASFPSEIQKVGSDIFYIGNDITVYKLNFEQ